MKSLSAVLFFLSHQPFWGFLALLAVGFLFFFVTNRWIFLLFGFLCAIGNIFLTHYINAWFLNKYGTPGTAVVTRISDTNSTLNDAPVMDYDVVVKTKDGKDVITGFSTMSAAIYPIRNQILIPPKGQRFSVKYIPGYEKNIVILSDDSEYGKARIAYENQEPIEQASIQYNTSPGNEAFKKQYIDELKAYLDNPLNHQDSGTIQRFRQVLGALQTGTPLPAATTPAPPALNEAEAMTKAMEALRDNPSDPVARQQYVKQLKTLLSGHMESKDSTVRKQFEQALRILEKGGAVIRKGNNAGQVEVQESETIINGDTSRRHTIIIGN